MVDTATETEAWQLNRTTPKKKVFQIEFSNAHETGMFPNEKEQSPNMEVEEKTFLTSSKKILVEDSRGATFWSSSRI